MRAHHSFVDLEVVFIVKGEIVVCEYKVTERGDFVCFFVSNSVCVGPQSISVWDGSVTCLYVHCG